MRNDAVPPNLLTSTVPRTAPVLLVNLGTPAAPNAGAVRRFLREFLSDPRVVEIPRVIWWPILYGLVLPLRPRKTAAKYAAIWSEQGSPLMAYSRQQASLLRGYLGERGLDVEVALAMRYGEPSIASALRRVATKECRPASGASDVSAVFGDDDRVGVRCRCGSSQDAAQRSGNSLGQTLSRSSGLHRGAETVGARSLDAVWSRLGRGGKLVISFHGVPKRTLRPG